MTKSQEITFLLSKMGPPTLNYAPRSLLRIILILLFFNHSTAGASFISITSISLDRFLMVASPIKHRILMKGKVSLVDISYFDNELCLTFSSNRLRY